MTNNLPQMTKQEAITRLKRLDNIVNNYYSEAIYIAIKAIDFLQECEDRCKESIMRSSEVVLSTSTKSESEDKK